MKTQWWKGSTAAVSACAVFAGALLLLAACAAPVAAPGAAPAAEATAASAAAPAVLTEVERSQAGDHCIVVNSDKVLAINDCSPTAELWDTAARTQGCTDIVTFNGTEAFANAAADLPIAWTFGVNFSLPANASKPLGCLRIYERNEGAGEYLPVDDGGIVVDTCDVKEPSSQGVALDINDDRAAFRGEGAVYCRIALSAWVNDSLLQNYLTGTGTATGNLGTELSNFAPDIDVTHTYTAFSLIGAVAWPGLDFSQEKQPLPIAQIVPDLDHGDLLSLELETFSGSAVTVPDVDCTPQKGWEITKGPHTWWLDFREEALIPGNYYPLYKVRTANGESGECTVPAPVGPVKFWLGPSTLFIGYNSLSDASFFGDIDAILIDPIDSKPPAKGPTE